ncbi:fimbrial protein [Klebsiella aerogenes]
MPVATIGYLCRVLLCLPLLSGGLVLAGNNTHIVIAGGIIHLKGQVTAGACAVGPDSLDKTVVMGQVRSYQFSGVGSWASPVPFTLQLVDCSTAVSQQVGMMFSGVTEGKDPLVFSAGSGNSAAKGVGIGIFDSQGELIVPNASPRHFTPLTQGTMVLPFTARYRATSRAVTPGEASTVVNFSLYYP